MSTTKARDLFIELFKVKGVKGHNPMMLEKEGRGERDWFQDVLLGDVHQLRSYISNPIL